MAPGQRQLDGGRCYVPRSDRRGFAVWQGDQLTAAAAFDLDRDGQRQHAVAYLQDVLLAGLLDADVVATPSLASADSRPACRLVIPLFSTVARSRG